MGGLLSRCCRRLHTRMTRISSADLPDAVGAAGKLVIDGWVGSIIQAVVAAGV